MVLFKTFTFFAYNISIFWEVYLRSDIPLLYMVMREWCGAGGGPIIPVHTLIVSHELHDTECSPEGGAGIEMNTSKSKSILPVLSETQQSMGFALLQVLGGLALPNARKSSSLDM